MKDVLGGWGVSRSANAIEVLHKVRQLLLQLPVLEVTLAEGGGAECAIGAVAGPSTPTKQETYSSSVIFTGRWAQSVPIESAVSSSKVRPESTQASKLGNSMPAIFCASGMTSFEMAPVFFRTYARQCDR